MFLWHYIDNTINSPLRSGWCSHSFCFLFPILLWYRPTTAQMFFLCSPRALFQQIYIFIWQSVNDFLVICVLRDLRFRNGTVLNGSVIWLALLMAINVCLEGENNSVTFWWQIWSKIWNKTNIAWTCDSQILPNSWKKCAHFLFYGIFTWNSKCWLHFWLKVKFTKNQIELWA